MDTFRHLTELALLYCQRIGNHALLEIGRGCKFLQALDLVDCSSIGDEAICNIARGCRNLKKLHIRRCYEVYFILSDLLENASYVCMMYLVIFCIKKIFIIVSCLGLFDEGISSFWL